MTVHADEDDRAILREELKRALETASAYGEELDTETQVKIPRNAVSTALLAPHHAVARPQHAVKDLAWDLVLWTGHPEHDERRIRSNAATPTQPDRKRETFVSGDPEAGLSIQNQRQRLDRLLDRLADAEAAKDVRLASDLKYLYVPEFQTIVDRFETSYDKRCVELLALEGRIKSLDREKQLDLDSSDSYLLSQLAMCQRSLAKAEKSTNYNRVFKVVDEEIQGLTSNVEDFEKRYSSGEEDEEKEAEEEVGNKDGEKANEPPDGVGEELADDPHDKLSQLRTKLESLKKKRDDAIRTTDIETASDLTYYAIPDLEHTVRKMEKSQPMAGDDDGAESKIVEGSSIWRTQSEYDFWNPPTPHDLETQLDRMKIRQRELEKLGEVEATFNLQYYTIPDVMEKVEKALKAQEADEPGGSPRRWIIQLERWQLLQERAEKEGLLERASLISYHHIPTVEAKIEGAEYELKKSLKVLMEAHERAMFRGGTQIETDLQCYAIPGIQDRLHLLENIKQRPQFGSESRTQELEADSNDLLIAGDAAERAGKRQATPDLAYHVTSCIETRTEQLGASEARRAEVESSEWPPTDCVKKPKIRQSYISAEALDEAGFPFQIDGDRVVISDIEDRTELSRLAERTKSLQREAAASQASSEVSADQDPVLTLQKRLSALRTKFFRFCVPDCEEFIASPPTDVWAREQEYRRLSETTMMTIVLKAKEVDTLGITILRNMRNSLLEDADRLLNRLDGARYGRYSDSTQPTTAQVPSRFMYNDGRAARSSKLKGTEAHGSGYGESSGSYQDGKVITSSRLKHADTHDAGYEDSRGPYDSHTPATIPLLHPMRQSSTKYQIIKSVDDPSLSREYTGASNSRNQSFATKDSHWAPSTFQKRQNRSRDWVYDEGVRQKSRREERPSWKEGSRRLLAGELDHSKDDQYQNIRRPVIRESGQRTGLLPKDTCTDPSGRDPDRDHNKSGHRGLREREQLQIQARGIMPKGILKAPRAIPFPEEQNPVREKVTSSSAINREGIPPNATWTKISKGIVNLEALEESNELYEEHDDYFVALRVVSREEIGKLAEKAREIMRSRPDRIAEKWRSASNY